MLLGLHGTEHVLAARLVIAVGTDLEPTRAAVWDLLAATPTTTEAMTRLARQPHGHQELLQDQRDGPPFSFQ